jgi:CxxC motif-containing protein (DUF1111 family)
LLAHPVTAQLGGETTRPLNAPNAFSFQAANAPRAHQRPFSFGNRLFNTNWVEAPASVKSFDGLGPQFNRVSCSACHTKDGRGQPPPNGQGPFDSLLLRISLPGENEQGGPKPLPAYGDQLNERAIVGLTPEGRGVMKQTLLKGSYGDGETYVLQKPVYTITDLAFGPLPEGTRISARVAPQMIGLGLLEAVSEANLQAIADPDDADGDGISGRTNRVWNAAEAKFDIGRFGWKAGQPDLLNQNAAAAIGDIGLTTTIHAQQNCTAADAACASAVSGGNPELSDEFLQKLTLYTATLAVPAQRQPQAPDVQKGAALFSNFGCTSCHLPTLQTSNHPLQEVANQTFHPYTDLLLHDMGEALADGRPEFAATGREWRTPPLWGLGLLQTVNGHTRLLHDGRANGFAEAILWHGGEAEKAKEAFRTAAPKDRAALVAFLKSL